MPTGTLPEGAKKTWEKIYQSVLDGSCKGDKECASKMAWAKMKSMGWHKDGESWVKSSDALQEFSMYFAKVGTNTKKWNMTASDTLLDQRDEAMSLELYRSFIDNIETDSPIPTDFAPLVTDSFWNGGMPYLSVAHFPALDGDGVPGDVHAVYVDGNQLKAKGVFNDTPLGIATWKSILADKQGVSAYEDKTRVSIGFLDLSHKHGDFVFERKSLEDKCPMCDEGAGNKTYLKGYLVHLAMTRVPVNPRSEVEVDLSMTTRKEDAASIVGEELAEELIEKQKALVGKSDILVERADEEVEEVATEKVDTVSTEEQTVEEKSDAASTAPVYMSGPTSMKAMMDAKAAKEELYHVQDMWYMAEDVIYNILSSEEVTNKKEAIGQVLDEFKSALATKSLVEMFAGDGVGSKVKTAFTVVDEKYNNLAEVIKSAIAEPIAPDEKLQKIQPALNDFATSIQEEVNKSNVATPVTPSVSETDVEGVISKAIQPLLEQMSLFREELKQVAATPVSERRVPQPRGISPIAVKSLVKTEQKQLSPIDKIAQRSVGLNVD